MAKNNQNNTQVYGRNINSVSSDSQSNGYFKNNDFLFSIERAISTTSTENEFVSDFDGQTNRSDFMYKGSVTTATSIFKNYTKESQKLKPFLSDEILEWSEVVLVLFLVLLIVITVIGKFIQLVFQTILILFYDLPSIISKEVPFISIFSYNRSHSLSEFV